MDVAVAHVSLRLKIQIFEYIDSWSKSTDQAQYSLSLSESAFCFAPFLGVSTPIRWDRQTSDRHPEIFVWSLGCDLGLERVEPVASEQSRLLGEK